MAARPLIALTLALGAGCLVEPPACEEVVARLLTCDLQPDALACEALTPAQQEGLFERLDEKGCEGLWSDDGSRVDRRACEAFGWDCPAPMEARNVPLQPKYPMVFVGGIDSSEIFSWNPRIPERIEAELQAPAYMVPLPAWSPREIRSAALYDALEALPGGRFNLVCYAVGGLDCRHLVSPGGLFSGDPERHGRATRLVASVTTIATPHRGTDVANAALSATSESTDTLLATLVGPGGLSGYGAEALVRDALAGLTNEALVGFNGVAVDNPEVYYQSWAGVSFAGGQPFYPTAADIEAWCEDGDVEPPTEFHDAMTQLLWTTAPFSTRTLDRFGGALGSPSDGMVSLDSARWGEFRGCVAADHYDVIGRIGDSGPDPRTGFDATSFYVDVAADLALEGL